MEFGVLSRKKDWDFHEYFYQRNLNEGMEMKKKLPAYSEQNPHPTAVIRELRYMARNSLSFHIPIAKWCLQNGLVKESESGAKYGITETGRKYIDRYRDFDPEPD